MIKRTNRLLDPMRLVLSNSGKATVIGALRYYVTIQILFCQVAKQDFFVLERKIIINKFIF